MEKFTFGIIGLGTMGSNLLQNIREHGFSVVGYDKDPQKANALNKAIHSEKDIAFSELKQFIERLETPRNIILLVPAGKIVDFVLQDLKTYWGENDVIVDCGS